MLYLKRFEEVLWSDEYAPSEHSAKRVAELLEVSKRLKKLLTEWHRLISAENLKKRLVQLHAINRCGQLIASGVIKDLVIDRRPSFKVVVLRWKCAHVQVYVWMHTAPPARVLEIGQRCKDMSLLL